MGAFDTNDELNNDNELQDLQLDLSGDDLTDSSFRTIPNNTWVHAVIYSAELGTVQKEGPNQGKPQAIFTFRLTGPSAKQYGPKTMRVWAQLYPGAFFTMYKILKALDYEMPKPENGGAQIKFTVPHPQKLVGQVLLAQVKHRAGNRVGEDGKPIMFENLVAFKSIREAEDGDGTVSTESAELFQSGAADLFS